MQLFANLSANELIGSIISPDDIVELYEEGFVSQNAILAICAQNELVRRGEFNKLNRALVECVKEGRLEFGTEFTHLIAMSLSGLGGLHPDLEELGDYLYFNADKTGVVTLDDIESLAQSPKIVDIGTRKRETIGVRLGNTGKLKLFM